VDTEFTIRLAKIDDMRAVFELSNDDAVRKNSINSEKILWENHVKWFENKINSEDSAFYIAETKQNDFIGQVRFDKKDGEFITSISIAEYYRGKNLGRKILKAAISKCGLENASAFIKKSNPYSLKAFLNAGYEVIGEDEEYFKLEFKNKVFIIAEMSANHCGDKELAKKIIAEAKACGADAVKIQTYTADTMTIDCKSDIFKVSSGTLWDGKYLYDLYKEAYTPWEWQAELKAYADSVGIEFFSTPFDFSAVDFLEDIGVEKYKIASFEAIDYPLVKYAASKGKPMIISVGISSEEEIRACIDACKSVGNNDITILKCTSAYPAKIEDMNLMTIKDMVEKFTSQDVKIGLSDHSMSIEPAIIAVSLGATVIEKHFTPDRKLGGADAEFSLEPQEFRSMVEAVRNTEKALGRVSYSVNEKNRAFARSLFVVKDIKEGEKFSAENIRSIRPGCGLHPKYYDIIVGSAAKRGYFLGEPLKLENLE